MRIRHVIPVAFTTLGAERVLRAECAVDEEDRRRGLMDRLDLPFPHGAALLCYPADGNLGVWMSDTPLRLSVAFLDAQKRVINLADLEPFSHDVVRCARPARYTLEVHRGWFRSVGIEPGAQARFSLPDGVAVT